MAHVLIHMEYHGGRTTSERIAAMLQTNPVVVRRTMAGLRSVGIVDSERGQGGGWRLNRQLAEVSLLDVYRALGSPELFAMGTVTDHPHCKIEAAVNAELDAAQREAEAAILARFERITLADLAQVAV